MNYSVIKIFVFICFLFSCSKESNEKAYFFKSSDKDDLKKYIQIIIPIESVYFEISEIYTNDKNSVNGLKKVISLTTLIKYSDDNYEKVKKEIEKSEKLENTYINKNVFKQHDFPKELLSNTVYERDGTYHLLEVYKPDFYIDKESIFQKGFCFLGGGQYILISLIED